MLNGGTEYPADRDQDGSGPGEASFGRCEPGLEVNPIPAHQLHVGGARAPAAVEHQGIVFSDLLENIEVDASSPLKLTLKGLAADDVEEIRRGRSASTCELQLFGGCVGGEPFGKREGPTDVKGSLVLELLRPPLKSWGILRHCCKHRPMRGIQSCAHNPDTDRSDPGIVGFVTFQLKGSVRNETRTPACGFDTGREESKGTAFPYLRELTTRLTTFCCAGFSSRLAGFGGPSGCPVFFPRVLSIRLVGISRLELTAANKLGVREALEEHLGVPRLDLLEGVAEDASDDRLGGVQPA